MNIDLRLGDCLEVLKTLPDNSVDSIVTDPPYHLTSITKRFGKEGSAPAKYGTDGLYQRASKGFMGKEWDGGDIAFTTELWDECLRVLKPGGHLLSFGGSRTYHRMACAIEDSGFEIRDQILFIYGSGFPKSHNISKAIDKKYGRLGYDLSEIKTKLKDLYKKSGKTLAKIDEECGFKASGYLRIEHRDDDGWGEALPTKERWQKISEVIGCSDSVYEEYKTYFEEAEREIIGEGKAGFLEKNNVFEIDNEGYGNYDLTKSKTEEGKKWEGWGTALKPAHEDIVLAKKDGEDLMDIDTDPGFYYGAKTSKKDRNEGLVDINNIHPTLKSTELMKYLIKLITPPGGVVLDPFMGSGSTGKAAVQLGYSFIGIEKEEEYFEIAKARIEHEKNKLIQSKLF